MTPAPAADALQHRFQAPDATPEELACAVARLVQPDLDAANCLRQLDELAAFVGRHLEVDAGHWTAQGLLDCLNGALGFRGNRDDYYDPRNSLLPAVLERRTGLPIMLSLLCMAIGRRLQLQIDGMGFPGHFMARYQDHHGSWLLDPFYATVVAPDEVAAHLEMALGKPVTPPPAPWAPVTPAQIGAAHPPQLAQRLPGAKGAGAGDAHVGCTHRRRTRRPANTGASEPCFTTASNNGKRRSMICAHYFVQRWPDTPIHPAWAGPQPTSRSGQNQRLGTNSCWNLYRESSVMLSKIN